MQRVDILASTFLILESGTRVEEGVEREELEAVLQPVIDSTGVASVSSDVAWVALGLALQCPPGSHQVEVPSGEALCMGPTHLPHS